MPKPGGGALRPGEQVRPGSPGGTSISAYRSRMADPTDSRLRGQPHFRSRTRGLADPDSFLRRPGQRGTRASVGPTCVPRQLPSRPFASCYYGKNIKKAPELVTVGELDVDVGVTVGVGVGDDDTADGVTSTSTQRFSPPS